MAGTDGWSRKEPPMLTAVRESLDLLEVYFKKYLPHVPRAADSVLELRRIVNEEAAKPSPPGRASRPGGEAPHDAGSGPRES
jgi:hypothetical protein